MSDFSNFPASNADDIEIKKRARRRLVGASALAVLAVVVLPLVDNNEASRTVPDMQVSIPGRGEHELPPLSPESGSESASSDIEPDAVPVASELPLEIPPSLPAQSSPPRSSPPPAQPAKPPAVPPAREARQENVPPRAAHATKDDEAARALALLNDTASKGSPKEAAKAKEQVFVQIGAYSNAARAAKSANELKKKGFAAYAEKAGKVMRVRIGPLSRSEGEKIVARLKTQGRKAVLVSR